MQVLSTQLMRTCFVHIGLHKTGSTAIQAALHGYDDGKTVVVHIGKPNHSTPLLMMFSADPQRAAKRIGIRVSRLDDYVHGLRKKIVSQFEASRSNFVISGEGLSRGLAPAEIAEFKAFLTKWFDDIRIIAYLREPASYIRSAFQQSAKSTVVAFDLSPFRPQYRKRIAGWIDVFGRDRVSVVLYDRRTFEGGSVILDFAQRVGADAARLRLVEENPSLRAEGLALTYAIRSEMASGRFSGIRWIRQRTDLSMARRFGTRDFDFSDRLYEAELAVQTDDIAWAEQVLQRPFPLRHRADNAVVFDSQDDILRYATQCRAEFDDWKCKEFQKMRRLSFLARSLRHKIDERFEVRKR